MQLIENTVYYTNMTFLKDNTCNIQHTYLQRLNYILWYVYDYNTYI